jgi:hypothetical protein
MGRIVTLTHLNYDPGALRHLRQMAARLEPARAAYTNLEGMPVEDASYAWDEAKVPTSPLRDSSWSPVTPSFCQRHQQ